MNRFTYVLLFSEFTFLALASTSIDQVAASDYDDDGSEMATDAATDAAEAYKSETRPTRHKGRGQKLIQPISKQNAEPSTSAKSIIAGLFAALDHDLDGALAVHELQGVLDACPTCLQAFNTFASTVQTHISKEAEKKAKATDEAKADQLKGKAEAAAAAASAASASANPEEERVMERAVDQSSPKPVTQKQQTSVTSSSIAPLQFREVTSDNFKSEVRDSNFVWMLEFHSGMCGACRQFSPVYEQLSRKLNDKVLIGKVNIDERAGLKLAEDLGVLQHGVPSIRLYTAASSEDGQTVLNGIDMLDGPEPTAESLAKVAFGHLHGLATADGGRLLKTGASSSASTSSLASSSARLTATSSALKAPRNPYRTTVKMDASDFV